MNQQLRLSRWPHRWAWLLACTTFPLLWVGGLITTTDAGMAVPDWPKHVPIPLVDLVSRAVGSVCRTWASIAGDRCRHVYDHLLGYRLAM